MYSGFKGYATWTIDKSALKGDFKYSCVVEYISSEKTVEYRGCPLYTVAEYLALYQRNPSLIEKMMKQGFKDLIWYHLERFNLHKLINFRKSDFYAATGLNKLAVKSLSEMADSDNKIRNIFRLQMVLKYGVTPQNAEWIINNYIYTCLYMEDYIKELKATSLDDFNNHYKYLRRQKVRHRSDYEDYIKQLKELKMPLSQENLYPHNFKQAHDALTVEINRRENAKKRAAAVREEKKFRKKYKELLSDLYFEDESFIIRPAKGDAELLDEGTVLSHCVHSYSERYKRGDTVICVIREKKNPEKPFYTLELSPDFTQIIQCRGKCNRGTTPEVEAFKKKWFARLQAKPGKEKLCQKTA